MKPKKIPLQRFDNTFFGLVVLLMGIGLVAVSSASAVLSFERFGHNNYYIYRQLLFAGIGFVTMLAASRIDYHFWKKWQLAFFVFIVLLLGAVLVPGVGSKVGAARSWFSIGPFLFQPSELAKLAAIFFLASWFERKKGAAENFWFGILPPLAAVGLLVGLVAIEPDTGTAGVLIMIAGAVLYAAGTKFAYLGALAAAGIAGLWFLIKAAPYRAARIVTFLDPSLDPLGIGYHINQALLAIGSGGWWGYGLGASRQKHNYLPEAIGDSIFAVMAEEMGFLRILFLVILFAVLAVMGLRIAKRAPDTFGKLVAAGITCWIVLQALVNIGAITGLMPLTGITLPFISYGGSSLLTLCLAAGIMLNISRQNR